jgi:hypothetical protein
MTRIEHDGHDFSASLDHVRSQLRLDRFGEVDARDEEFVIVRDDGETKPVPNAVHDSLPAVETDLQLVSAVVEDDAFSGGIDVAHEPVELRDVVEAEVIARTDLDNLPVIVRGRGRVVR